MKEQKNKNLKYLYIVAGIVVVLLLIVAGMVAYLLLQPKNAPEHEGVTPEASISSAPALETGGNGLSESLLPENLYYGKELPVEKFLDKNGEMRSLEEFRGKNLILIFWNSWCSDCSEALQAMPVYESVLTTRQDTNLLLVARLDEEQRETIQTAEAKRAEEKINFESWYDKNLEAYHAYGAKQIPTMLILNREGKLSYMTTDIPNIEGTLEAVLDDVADGSAKATLAYLEGNLMNEDGAVFTSVTEKENGVVSGKAVLSESLGLLLEYSVMAGNQELFSRESRFLQENMSLGDCYAWYFTENGKKAGANALLDDLRVLKAIDKANALWGGFEQEEETLAQGILEHNLRENGFVSFYDFNMNKQGTDISLSYIDGEALKILEKYDDKVSSQISALEKILENGYIGDDFPLYYASYDYETEAYSTEKLNIAEALLTLYHLAQRGNLKEASVDWLKARLADRNLAARYRITGEVVEGYQYDSTAVYGIAALIAQEISDDSMYRDALQAMEKFRVRDRADSLNGSFTGTEDGSDITAFDQLIPLLVYGKEEEEM